MLISNGNFRRVNFAESFLKARVAGPPGPMGMVNRPAPPILMLTGQAPASKGFFAVSLRALRNSVNSRSRNPL